MDEQEISLTELLAICLRRGKAALITALVFAVLLGGYQCYRQIRASQDEEYSAEKIEERYQDALEAYEKSIEDLEKSIEKTQKQLETRTEYQEKSYLMHIDPYNKYVTTIYFALTDIDEAAWDQLHYSNTSVDYVASRIRAQYLVFWNSLDLPSDLGLSAYRDSEDKYVREILSVTSADGGMICITGIGGSAVESERLADAVYGLFAEQQPTIAHSSYGHDFTVVNTVTKVTIDTGLETTQQNLEDELEGYQDTLEDYDERMEDLLEEEPEKEEGYSLMTILKAVVKYAVIGLIGGLFVAFVCIWIIVLFRGSVETSYQLERGFKLPFLGSLAPKAGLFGRWANAVCGERVWKDPEQALSFSLENTRARLAGKEKVLLASTLSGARAKPAAEKFRKALSEAGCQVSWAEDIVHNPAAVQDVKESDALVLLESVPRSRMAAVADAVTLAKSADRPVAGFILF